MPNSTATSPLHRHLAVRDRREQPGQVGEHRPLVGAQQRLLLLRDDVSADRGERRRVLDLETHTITDDTFAAQRGEGRIRPEVGVGITQVRPRHLGRIDTVGQPQLRHLLVVALRTERPGRNQRGRLQELLHLEEDPVTPVPGLAVRNPPHARRDPRSDLPHHRLGIGQVDTAVEMGVRRRHSTGSPLVTTSSIHHTHPTPPVTRAGTAGPSRCARAGPVLR